MANMGDDCKLCFLIIFSGLLIMVLRPAYAYPGVTPSLQSGQRPISCGEDCQLTCRGSSDSTATPKRFCYCRCRATDYGSLVYAAVVDDIWQIRCGYLGHPFVSTALAMNESGLLDEYAATRCESDYTDECRNGDPSEVCSQWWAAALCLETCADFPTESGSGTVAPDPSTTTTAAHNRRNTLCAPDKYFRSQKPTFGNPYTGCVDFQRDCSGLYDRGYCQLKPGAVNCQETCGRCVGDDAYMPWNPIRAQLIQWAMYRRDDGTARTLINYFMRQFSDFMSEVHRSCREEVASFEYEHRMQAQNSHELGQRRRVQHDGEQDS